MPPAMNRYRGESTSVKWLRGPGLARCRLQRGARGHGVSHRGSAGRAARRPAKFWYLVDHRRANTGEPNPRRGGGRYGRRAPRPADHRPCGSTRSSATTPSAAACRRCTTRSVVNSCTFARGCHRRCFLSGSHWSELPSVVTSADNSASSRRMSCHQIPCVGQSLSVTDNPDVESSVVTDDRDVECETVKHQTHRVVSQERGAVAAQLDGRPRHVRDDQVHRWAHEARRDQFHQATSGDAEYRQRDWLVDVAQERRRRLARALLCALERFVCELESLAVRGQMGRDRRNDRRDRVAVAVFRVGQPGRHRDVGDKWRLPATRRSKSTCGAARRRTARSRRR